MTSHVHSRILEYKRWADAGLYRVVTESLDRLEPFDREIVLRTLDHMHVVDTIFQHHLLGKGHGYLAARSPELPALGDLAERVRELDDWYVDYAGTLPQDRLEETLDFTFTSGASGRMRRGDMILHVALHGSSHRGAAIILLQKNGVTPNDDRLTDFLQVEL